MDKAGMGRKYRMSKPSASIPPRNGVQPLYPSAHAPSAPAHTKPQGNNHAQKPGNPEIMKRPIRYPLTLCTLRFMLIRNDK